MPVTPRRRAALCAVAVLALVGVMAVVVGERGGRENDAEVGSARGAALHPAAAVVVRPGPARGGDAGPIRLPRDWQTRYRTHDPSSGLLRASVDAAREGHGVPTRLVPSIARARDSIANLSPCNYAVDSVRRLCPRGDVDGRRTMVVVGDSHARHWIGAFERIAERNGYVAYYLAKSSCLAAWVTPDEDDGRPWRGCRDFHRFAARTIAELQPELVVVSSSTVRGGVFDVDGDYVTGRPDVRDALYDGHVALFEHAQANADRVLLLEDTPQPDRRVPDCLRGGSLAECLSRAEHTRNVDARDQRHAADEVGVEVIDTRQWFCWQGLCPAVVGNRIPFRDDQHVTVEYGVRLADSLAVRMGLRPPSE